MSVVLNDSRFNKKEFEKIINIKTVKIGLFSISLQVCFGLITFSASADEFASANFIDGGKNYVDRIEIPPSDLGGIVLVRCAAEINHQGLSNYIVCYSDENNAKELEPYEAAIRSGMRRLKINPARVNGNKTEVWFNFSVAFIYDQSGERVEIYPSHLLNMKEYGESYIGAQRCRFPRFPVACQHNTRIWASVEIMEDGSAVNPRIIGGRANSVCKNSVLNLMKEKHYIPAFSDGRPVKSIYMEAFFRLNSVIRF